MPFKADTMTTKLRVRALFAGAFFFLGALHTSCASSAPKPTSPVPSASAPTSTTPAPCLKGHADCDGDPSNGCEADLASRAACGQCGVACAAGESCIEGLCRREHRLDVEPSACAIRSGGVYCWGPPLGADDTFESGRADTLPRRLEGAEDAVTIRFNASLSAPACAVRRSGGVQCWPETPAALADVKGARDVVAYGGETCVVSASGVLLCGQSELQGVQGVVDATAVVASDDSFFALRKSGHVVHVAPDEGAYVGTKIPGVTDAVDVAAAHHSFCILRASGRVVCSGPEPATTEAFDPAKRPLVEIPGLSDAIAVDVGCALRSSGEAVAWDSPGAPPTSIPGVTNAKSIACGPDFGCYERADGAVFCWGSRRSGRLGDGAEITQPAPVVVEGVTGVKAVVVGRGTCALREDGSVWCWGRNDNRADRRGVPAERVPGLDGASSLTASRGRACAVDTKKAVVCFEAGLPLASVAVFTGLGDVTKAVSDDQLGVARRAGGDVVLFDARATKGMSQPRFIRLEGVSDAVDVALSYREVCVLRRGGAVACASISELKGGELPRAMKLIKASGAPEVAQMVSGSSVCAVSKSGDGLCFEMETQKGTSRLRVTAGVSTRGTMSGLTRFVEGGLANCGLTTRGQVLCQSKMSGMMRGTGLVDPPAGDAPVKGVSDAVDVAIDGGHACAALATGRVVCWGSNAGDALGGGDSPVSLAPIEVPLGASR